MTDKIPNDVMEAARLIARAFTCSFKIPDRQEVNVQDYLSRHIARALLSERESATKAERERCALIASEGSFPFDISVWLESTKKEMTAITAEAIAAAIRKGETQ